MFVSIAIAFTLIFLIVGIIIGGIVIFFSRKLGLSIMAVSAILAVLSFAGGILFYVQDSYR